MPNVKSRTNGLIIGIPADAAGVVGRFATKGDNELVFENPRPKQARPTAFVDETPAEFKSSDREKGDTATSEFA